MKQHILPKLYLKGFTDLDHATPNHVWVYEATERSWKTRGIRIAAQELDYYTFRDRSGARDDTFEDLLNLVETKAAPLLHEKILLRKALDSGEKAMFALFVALIFLRVPEYHDWFGGFASDVLQQLAEIQHQDYLQHAEKFEALKANYRRETGTTDADHLQPEDIAPGRFHALRAAKPLVIGISLLQVEEFSKAIAQMDWTFLKSPSADSFITSDAPCFMVDPMRTPDGYLGGWQNKDVEITLPLSRDIALLARWQNESGWFVATRETLIR